MVEVVDLARVHDVGQREIVADMEAGSLQQVGQQLLQQRQILGQREIERAGFLEPVRAVEADRQQVADAGQRYVRYAVAAQGLRDLLLRCAYHGAFVGRVHRVDRVVDEQGVPRCWRTARASTGLRT